MTSPLVVVLKRRVPSANAFNNKRGIPASFAYRKDRDTWLMLLRAAVRPRPAPEKCHVRVEIHSFRNRVLDDANLRGGCKGIIDNLKRLGLIYDDAPRYFHGDYLQHQVPRIDERTVLVIHPPTPLPKEDACKSRRTK